MKTPMQEMLEYVQEEVQLFGSARQSLISKIKQLLEKEEEVIIKAAALQCYPTYEDAMMYAEQYYNETFKNKATNQKTKHMSKEIIITGFSNVGKEGLTLHTNEKSRLKGSNGMGVKERWVSWDKIGNALFEDYMDKVEVAELKMKRLDS